MQIPILTAAEINKKLINNSIYFNQLWHNFRQKKPTKSFFSSVKIFLQKLPLLLDSSVPKKKLCLLLPLFFWCRTVERKIFLLS